MDSGWLIVNPAYGRTYGSNEEMRTDWENGKDFRCASGPYCSKRDLPKILNDGYVGVQIVQHKRYFDLPDGRTFRVPFLTEEIR